MGERAVPIVRSGTVAAVGQPDITWETGNYPTVRTWTARETHLIDVRSYAGFSGSPCWVQFLLGTNEVMPYPSAWQKRIRAAGEDPDKITPIVTMTHWWGMFVAHDKPTGIGVVVPAADIIAMLSLPKVQTMKKRQEEKIEAERRDRGGPTGQGVGSDAASEFREAFQDLSRTLVQVPKSEIDAERARGEEKPSG